VASFFEPCILRIKAAIKEQLSGFAAEVSGLRRVYLCDQFTRVASIFCWWEDLARVAIFSSSSRRLSVRPHVTSPSSRTAREIDPTPRSRLLRLQQRSFRSRSKAVADGAVMWNCLQTVKARVARHSFGVGYLIPFDPEEATHQGRTPKRGQDGLTWVGPVWDLILSQVCHCMALCDLIQSDIHTGNPRA
jgi:hypothetical protein